MIRTTPIANPDCLPLPFCTDTNGARVRIPISQVRIRRPVASLWIELIVQARSCATAITGDSEMRPAEEVWVEPDGSLTLQMRLPRGSGEMTITIPAAGWIPQGLYA